MGCNLELVNLDMPGRFWLRRNLVQQWITRDEGYMIISCHRRQVNEMILKGALENLMRLTEPDVGVRGSGEIRMR
jgi:hypothetical protein